MIKKGQDIWERLYTERTNMLWSKEEYLSSTHTYQMLIMKKEEMQAKGGDRKQIEVTAGRLRS